MQRPRRSAAAAAVRAFRDALAEAVACVTAVPLTVGREGLDPATPPGRGRTLTFITGRPAPLAGALRLSLALEHHYWLLQPTPRGPWHVKTAAYFYYLFDQAEHEIVAYHYHPDVPGVPYPHLHIGPGAVAPTVIVAAGRSPQHNALRPEVQRLHLPTRRVALEDVVRVAIEQLGVQPNRQDWDATLRRSREQFSAHRTWV